MTTMMRGSVKRERERGSVKRERERGESSSRRRADYGGRRKHGNNVEFPQTPTPAPPMSTPMPTPSIAPTPYSAEMECPDRRLLRSRYRELKLDVSGRKTELAQADFVEFRALVERAEKLHKHVIKPREQITDAELLIDITSELLCVAKKAQTKGGMSAAEFVGAVIHSHGLPGSADGDSGQSLDWEALGLEASVILRYAPGMSTMVGPMDVELKKRKIAVRGRREKPTERTRPQTVEEADADRPNSETDANMATMFKILSERKSVQVDHMVLNRVSFAQTIENLFALSFLVKDGRVEYKFSEDGIQSVVPRNAPAHADRTEGTVLNTQFVFRYDFKCWRLMQESVQEGHEVMPRRESAESPAPLPKTARTPIRKNSRNRARETPAVAPPGDSPEEASGDGSSRFKRRLVLPSD